MANSGKLVPRPSNNKPTAKFVIPKNFEICCALSITKCELRCKVTIPNISHKIEINILLKLLLPLVFGYST